MTSSPERPLFDRDTYNILTRALAQGQPEVEPLALQEDEPYTYGTWLDSRQELSPTQARYSRILEVSSPEALQSASASSQDICSSGDTTFLDVVIHH